MMGPAHNLGDNGDQTLSLLKTGRDRIMGG